MRTQPLVKNELHKEASDGNVAAVRQLVEKGVYLEAKDEDEWTALLRAAESGHHAVIQLLVKEGADVEARDRDGWTALLRAAESGHHAVIQLLVGVEVNIKARNNEGRTALHCAALKGHKDVVSMLLDNGAEIGGEDGLRKQTPLHLAACGGYGAVVQLLVEKGADVVARDCKGRTALYYAALNGHKEVMPLLKASLEAKNGGNGWTTLLQAAYHGDEQAVRLLVEVGAEINAKNNEGRTALHRAVLNGNKSLARLLVEKNVDIEAKDEEGRTALHYAALNKREKIVQQLVKRADVEAVDKKGRTALHYAALNGDKGVVQLLVEKGADIGAMDEHRWTALLLAAYRGAEPVVWLLIEKGADINATTNQGLTALHCAVLEGCEKVVRLLLRNGLSVSTTDNLGHTALDYTKLKDYRSREVVQLLKERVSPIGEPSGRETIVGEERREDETAAVIDSEVDSVNERAAVRIGVGTTLDPSSTANAMMRNEVLDWLFQNSHEGIKNQEETETKAPAAEDMAIDPSRPTWIRVKRKWLLPETLDHYCLPWEWDEDSEYIVIKQYIDIDLQDRIFEHTRMLKERKIEGYGDHAESEGSEQGPDVLSQEEEQEP